MRDRISFKKGFRARSVFHIFNISLMVLLIIVMLVPMIKILSDSLDKVTTYGINLFPKKPSLLAYMTIFSKKEFIKPIFISVITTVSGTCIGLTLTTLGAYVLSKRDLIGRDFLAMFVFITFIFNGGMVPLFLVVKGFHLTNTLFSVLLPTAVQVFYIILMRNFFEQIPKSLFESAEIDGATPMRIFFSIVLPLSTAGLACIGLFYIVQYWNSYFDYIMYISNTDLFNFQVKLREMIQSEQALDNLATRGYGNMVRNAAVIVAMLPFLFIYPFTQKYFITGITLGSVKE